MRTVGIIAEYDPFHNGHAWQIAEAKRLANEAEVAAATEIAARKNELRIKEAELKRESDVKQAEADAAYAIQREEQRKTIVTRGSHFPNNLWHKCV